MVNVVPLPSVDATVIHPRAASTMLRTVLRPRPVPLESGFVVKNGSKTRARTAGGMPMPSSATSITTYCSSEPRSHIDSVRVEIPRKQGYRALRERYTSKVMLDPEARRIDVVAIEGPFHCLENHWHFTPEGDSARLDFRVAFEFSSRLLQMAAGSAFEKVLMKMTDAFEARAASLSPSTG